MIGPSLWRHNLPIYSDHLDFDCAGAIVTTCDVTYHFSPWLLQLCPHWPACMSYTGLSSTCTSCGCSNIDQLWLASRLSPALQQLHWLLVNCPIDFKIALLTKIYDNQSYPCVTGLSLVWKACILCLWSQHVERVPRQQPHRHSGLATLPSVGAFP